MAGWSFIDASTAYFDRHDFTEASDQRIPASSSILRMTVTAKFASVVFTLMFQIVFKERSSSRRYPTSPGSPFLAEVYTAPCTWKLYRLSGTKA
jgi:hypothetical protein